GACARAAGAGCPGVAARAAERGVVGDPAAVGAGAAGADGPRGPGDGAVRDAARRRAASAGGVAAARGRRDGDRRPRRDGERGRGRRGWRDLVVAVTAGGGDVDVRGQWTRIGGAPSQAETMVRSLIRLAR